MKFSGGLSPSRAGFGATKFIQQYSAKEEVAISLSEKWTVRGRGQRFASRSGKSSFISESMTVLANFALLGRKREEVSANSRGVDSLLVY